MVKVVICMVKCEDLVLKVPPGTIIKSVETEEVLADLVEEGQRAVVARGGRGGRGNSRFATLEIQLRL